MSEFKWAYGQEANIKEPIASLKEKGWQYADVPTASNFNWIFNELQKELQASKAAFAELNTSLDNLSLDFKNIKDKLTSELKGIKDNATAIKNTANQALHEGEVNSREIELRARLFYQLCELLKTQETTIRRYHPSFPIHPWPSDSSRSVRDLGMIVEG